MGACSMDVDLIHGSLHILVDPVTRLMEENVKNPRVGWVKSMGRGDRELLRGMK